MKIIGVVKITQDQHDLVKLTRKGLFKHLFGLPLSEDDVEKTLHYPGRPMVENVVIDPEDEFLVLGEKVQEIRFDGLTLKGVLPIREAEEGWECAVDMVERK